jgi:hypothetical protein
MTAVRDLVAIKPHDFLFPFGVPALEPLSNADKPSRKTAIEATLQIRWRIIQHFPVSAPTLNLA